jgi:hypothetical protein
MRHGRLWVAADQRCAPGPPLVDLRCQQGRCQCRRLSAADSAHDGSSAGHTTKCGVPIAISC